jgi:high-affinity nickel permease
MFGLDETIAHLSNGTTLAVVALVATVLGLRHASDPDHLAAVTTLIASRDERAARAAGRLGFVWGAGHATSLFVFGVPIVLFHAYLPERVQQGAETAVGLLIVALAVSLLVRWRHGHAHARVRTGGQAYAIGLVHGMGGSAGVGVLLLATIRDHGLALAALAVFAFFTAVSMALLSTGLGATLARRRLPQLAPALGFTSLAFGVWYALGALSVAPYFF